MDFWHKIRSIFIHPKYFFESVKGDTGFIDAWTFYAIASAILYGVLFLVSIPLVYIEAVAKGGAGLVAVPFAILFLGFILAFLFFLGLGLVFVTAGFLHLFLLLVGAKGGFYQTFKITAYAYIIGLLSFPFSSAVEYLPSLVGYVVYYSVLLLVMVYAFYVEVIGAKVVHKLSTLRAIIGVVVLPLLIGMLIALFFIIVLGFFLGLATMSTW